MRLTCAGLAIVSSWSLFAYASSVPAVVASPAAHATTGAPLVMTTSKPPGPSTPARSSAAAAATASSIPGTPAITSSAVTVPRPLASPVPAPSSAATAAASPTPGTSAATPPATTARMPPGPTVPARPLSAAPESKASSISGASTVALPTTTAPKSLAPPTPATSSAAVAISTLGSPAATPSPPTAPKPQGSPTPTRLPPAPAVALSTLGEPAAAPSAPAAPKPQSSPTPARSPIGPATMASSAPASTSPAVAKAATTRPALSLSTAVRAATSPAAQREIPLTDFSYLSIFVNRTTGGAVFLIECKRQYDGVDAQNGLNWQENLIVTLTYHPGNSSRLAGSMVKKGTTKCSGFNRLARENMTVTFIFTNEISCATCNEIDREYPGVVLLIAVSSASTMALAAMLFTLIACVRKCQGRIARRRLRSKSNLAGSAADLRDSTSHYQNVAHVRRADNQSKAPNVSLLSARPEAEVEIRSGNEVARSDEQPVDRVAAYTSLDHRGKSLTEPDYAVLNLAMM